MDGICAHQPFFVFVFSSEGESLLNPFFVFLKALESGLFDNVLGNIIRSSRGKTISPRKVSNLPAACRGTWSWQVNIFIVAPEANGGS